MLLLLFLLNGSVLKFQSSVCVSLSLSLSLKVEGVYRAIICLNVRGLS